MTRFCEYQSWFIPLIWLYWPNKSNKKRNNRSIKAVRSLDKACKRSGLQRSTEKSANNSDGYASLDDESYLDYDNQSFISDN